MTEPSTDQTARSSVAYREVFEAVGIVAGVAALLVVAVPSVARVVTRTVGPIFGSPVLVGLAGLIAFAFALVGFWRRGTGGDGPDPIVESPPERAQYGRQDVAGESIDESVDTVGGELPEAQSADYFTHREKQDVQNRLRTVAVNVLASEYDVSREAAASMIADGSWTDRERAAALLGGERAATLSPRTQFVDWLSGNAYERRVEVAVAEISRHAGVATEAGASGSAASRRATESALPVSERTLPQSVADAIDRATTSTAGDDGDRPDVSLDLDGPASAEGADDRSESDQSSGEQGEGESVGGQSGSLERDAERVADAVDRTPSGGGER